MAVTIIRSSFFHPTSIHANMNKSNKTRPYGRICVLSGALLLVAGMVQGQGFLHAKDKKIVDGQGNEVLLKGIGLGGWMLQEPYMLHLSGVAVNQQDIRTKITALI